MRARALAAALALVAAWPAQAYKRSCATNDGRTVCFYWPDPSAVTWKVNAVRGGSSPSCDASSGADPAVQAAQAAFAAWEGATRAGGSAPCAHIALPFGGTTTTAIAQTGMGTSGEHVVAFRKGWCSDVAAARADACYSTGSCDNKYDCFDDEGGLGRSVLAITTIIYSSSTGAIQDADTEVADWSGAGAGTSLGTLPDGWYFTCGSASTLGQTCGTYGEASCGFEDLQNTLTHEAGHFIGLAHPCESKQVGSTPACADMPQGTNAVTMYPTAPPKEIQKRTLADDDVEGACAIYTAAGPVQEITGNKRSSGGGCGTGGDGALGALLLAGAAWLPRLRRKGSRQRTTTPA
ncbi:peptidase M10A and M12B matrixin and adamalysin [Anaeromyxobacter sp. K]|uniref:peptidase M10 n=1 Tax=Anaeromyxobacter sp. (strain K) TaxID=447217 RepID=UPI00015F901E|nr:peptidase M10 [Anaeromyxobacter sp. K]ACG72486.1 peptidase M10A and M12B matrixin and adamalysin [Anaeromyxobacter sp. K]